MDNNSDELKHINTKFIANSKRLRSKYPGDCLDFLLLSNSRCLALSSTVLLPFMLASDFVDYSKSVEKPLCSVRYVNLDDAVHKFHQVFRGSVDRVANFSRNLITKQTKKSSTYGYAILKDISQGSSAMYQFYVPLHEVIASLKNPSQNMQLNDIITNWDNFLSSAIPSSSLSCASSCIATIEKNCPSTPAIKQIGSRKKGEAVGILPLVGKDRLYLKRCYLYGSAVALSPPHIENPIGWLRKNHPLFLNYLKLTQSKKLKISATSKALWVDNSITREVEAKILPEVKPPPLLDCTNTDVARNDFNEHLKQLCYDNIMAIHVFPPTPCSVTDDKNMNASHVKLTEELRCILWSILRGIQGCCSSSLVFPPYRLKSYCSLIPSHFTSDCTKYITQNLCSCHPQGDGGEERGDERGDERGEERGDERSDERSDEDQKIHTFCEMTTKLPQSTLFNPNHPTVCVLLPQHKATWRMDFPFIECSGSNKKKRSGSTSSRKGISSSRNYPRGVGAGMKLALYDFLHEVIITCMGQTLPLNIILYPVLPLVTNREYQQQRPRGQNRSYVRPSSLPGNSTDSFSKLDLKYEIAVRQNFVDGNEDGGVTSVQVPEATAVHVAEGGTVCVDQEQGTTDVVEPEAVPRTRMSSSSTADRESTGNVEEVPRPPLCAGRSLSKDQASAMSVASTTQPSVSLSSKDQSTDTYASSSDGLPAVSSPGRRTRRSVEKTTTLVGKKRKSRPDASSDGS